MRILRAAEGAADDAGFASTEAAGQCVSGIIGAGIIPVAIEYMDKPAIEIREAFAKAGYPRDVVALLIVEVEGSEAEITEALARVVEIARPTARRRRQRERGAERPDLEGRKSAFGAVGRISDYYCMDGTIPPAGCRRCSPRSPRSARAMAEGRQHLPRRRRQPAPPHPLRGERSAAVARGRGGGREILKLCVEVGGCLTGEHGVGIEKRDLMRVQFSETDLAVQMRIKTVFDPGWLLNPAKVFPLEGRETTVPAAA